MPTTGDAPAAQYPRRLIALSPARRRFGSAADMIGTMLRVGDPLGDAAVTDLAGHRVPPAAVTALLEGRSASVAVPDSLTALVAELERLPSWVRPERLQRGSAAYLGIGTVWMQLLLGPGSLINTYRSPGLARVLTSTGRLVTRAPRRIQETGAWLGSAVQPRALRVGAPGYVATAQVRLFHARMRAELLRRGWDVEQWGVPINQADLARTLLDFTYVPIQAMGRLGVGLRPHERDDVHHLFRYIAHLLGIDPALQVDDHAGATNLAALLEMVTPPPDEGSRALVDALLEAYAQLLTPVIHTPEGMTRELVLALAQIFHGAPVCRRLGMAAPAWWAVAAVRALGIANSLTRLAHRAVPAAGRRQVRRAHSAIQQHASLLTGPTAYQHVP